MKRLCCSYNDLRDLPRVVRQVPLDSHLGSSLRTLAEERVICTASCDKRVHRRPWRQRHSSLIDGKLPATQTGEIPGPVADDGTVVDNRCSGRGRVCTGSPLPAHSNPRVSTPQAKFTLAPSARASPGTQPPKWPSPEQEIINLAATYQKTS